MKNSRITELIILITLTSLLSSSNCLRKNITSGLNCTAVTFEEKRWPNLANSANIYSNNKTATTNVTVRRTVINQCQAGYPVKEIIRKCENLIDLPGESYPELFIPVTDPRTNITYWNTHCADCNGKFGISNWDRWIAWEQHQRFGYPCDKYEAEIQISDVDRILNLTQMFINKGMRLVTMLTNSRELECQMKGRWPIHLLNRVIPCLVENFRSGQTARLEPCQYSQKNGTICTKMRLFIEGIGFVFGNRSNTIYEKWTQLPLTRGEYVVQSGYDNVFYLCERPEIIYSAGHWGKISITVVSLIFISVYLVLKFDTEYFRRNFADKVIYSYSAGLIMMYFLLVFVYLSFPVPCVMFYLAQFSWFYHLFWTKIIMAEFFHLIYYVCRKRKLDTKSQRKRYVVCSIIGYVLPTILLLIYYFVLESTDNNCPSIPGYFSAPCIPTTNSKAESFMGVLILIMKKNFNFFMPFLFLLAHVCVIVYFSKCGTEGLKSTENKRHLIAVMKMSYIMAFHWTLHRICVWYDRGESFTIFGQSTNMDTISQLSVDLHGVLVFLVFGLEKNILNGVSKKCRCKSKTSGEQSSDEGSKTNAKIHSSADNEETKL